MPLCMLSARLPLNRRFPFVCTINVTIENVTSHKGTESDCTHGTQRFWFHKTHYQANTSPMFSKHTALLVQGHGMTAPIENTGKENNLLQGRKF